MYPKYKDKDGKIKIEEFKRNKNFKKEKNIK
jgi:hypothetical protein